MNPLSLWRLRQFCESSEIEIDIHEIDNSLDYHENMKHLEEFRMRTLEELAKAYDKVSYPIEQEPFKPKKWIPLPSKKKWITISRTHIELK